MTTLSIIKADTGGYVGHSDVHPDMMDAARRAVTAAVDKGLLTDGHVSRCGDDISLIMTHDHGPDSEIVHSFAWSTFLRTTQIAKRLGLYGAGQDLLSDAFSGNLRGMGPGYAELEFVERPSEPVICFLADKTEPGAWNLPLYKMFADPFNTAGLVIDKTMHDGFRLRRPRLQHRPAHRADDMAHGAVPDLAPASAPPADNTRRARNRDRHPGSSPPDPRTVRPAYAPHCRWTPSDEEEGSICGTGTMTPARAGSVR